MRHIACKTERANADMEFNQYGQCPFLYDMRGNPRAVRCEGMQGPGSVAEMWFISMDLKNAWTHKHCMMLHGHTECPYAQAMYEKYREAEG